MKVIFATWLTDRTLGDSLTKYNANDRLLSYYFIKEQLRPDVYKEQTVEYVRTGKLDPRKEENK